MPNRSLQTAPWSSPARAVASAWRSRSARRTAGSQRRAAGQDRRTAPEAQGHRVHRGRRDRGRRRTRRPPWSATCARRRTCSAPSTPPSSVSAASTSASTTPVPSRPSGPRSCRAKKFDLMHEINGRGTFLLTKACLPHLRKSANAARADDRAAAESEPVLAGRAPGLHAVQVRHDAAVAGLGRRVPPTPASPSTACGRRPTSPPPP